MKKHKRTLIKTIYLLICRYYRWENNPRNIEKVAIMKANFSFNL